MKHTRTAEPKHTDHKVRSATVEFQPLTAQNPGDAFLRREIEQNRKSERWLILKGFISLALVAILVTIRLVFFT